MSLESPGQLAAVCHRGGIQHDEDGSLVTNELSGDLRADAAAIEREGAGDSGAEGERQAV